MKLGFHQVVNLKPTGFPLLRPFLVFLLPIVILVSTGLEQRGSGQDKVTLSAEQWETGFHAFAQIMRKRGIDILNDYNEFEKGSEADSIWILMGRVSQDDQASIGRFVRNGGSVLLATDVDFGPISLDGLSLQIRNGGLVHAARSRDRYGGTSGWPRIRPKDPAEPLFDGVSMIVANFPALLLARRTRSTEYWEELADYPNLRTFGSGYPFILKYTHPEGGKLLVIPDHSVFVNGSVVVADNLRFMLNTVDWLREGNRSRCLFVLNRISTAPMNVSNIELYRAPPGASETKRALRQLWKNTSTRDKIELLNEALEFTQEEQLVEQLVDSIKVDEIISDNRLLAVFLVLGSWCVIIPFVVFLVSNRKKPLEGDTTDGLSTGGKRVLRRRAKLERSRAAEALFVHFFNRLGLDVANPGDVDVERIQSDGNLKELQQIRKEIQKVQQDLMRQPAEYWSESKVEEVGRHIAHWANLSETGVLRIDPPN